MRLAVLLAISITTSGCLGSTRTERRNLGVACVATGVAAVALGTYAITKANEQEGFDGLETGLAGNALLAAGLTTVAIGGGNLFSAFLMGVQRPQVAPLPEQPAVTPPPAETDAAACVSWQAHRDDERDPARQAALDAARPAHCRVTARPAR